MPPYPWLYTQSIDPELTAGKIKALRTVGVPYEEGYEKVANAELKEQATQILKDLEEDPSGSLQSYEALNEVKITKSSEIIALIAYLQRLGTDIKAESTENK